METAIEVEERILPGKDIPYPKGTTKPREDIGETQATCPFCFSVIRSDWRARHRYENGPDACEHFSRITGGCGVSAAFYFYNPPQGRY